jgi:hypothetical protein
VAAAVTGHRKEPRTTSKVSSPMESVAPFRVNNAIQTPTKARGIQRYFDAEVADLLRLLIMAVVFDTFDLFTVCQVQAIHVIVTHVLPSWHIA